MRESAAARSAIVTPAAPQPYLTEMRIALIHALRHSIAPIEAAFAKLWPDARLMNLLDDSPSADLAREGRLTDGMTERFLRLGRYAAGTGADAPLHRGRRTRARIDAGAQAQ